MSELGYGSNYLYAHDYPQHFVHQQYLPDTLIGTKFWQADTSNAQERQLAERQTRRWGKTEDETKS